ncbi:DUF421 domain-containing protein [Bacillus sp. BGMRC 2118]|nr:DUF421 domain-containing protein [Bacillus sp. BGMRC 2118]
MNVTELLIRIAISFLVLLTLARIMGRQEIRQMTFFNFVSAISIGTIGGSLAISQDLSIRNGVIALVAWTVFTLAMEYIDLKSNKARILIEGQPVIVIQNGQIMEKAMRTTRLDINSLNSMLRDKNVFSMKDVEYAIFETDGKLSVMKKEDKQALTKGDYKMPTKTKSIVPIATSVITDGRINNQNLQNVNLSEKWLEEELTKMGVQSVEDVFYAEIQQDGTLYIDKRNDTVH